MLKQLLPLDWQGCASLIKAQRQAAAAQLARISAARLVALRLRDVAASYRTRITGEVQRVIAPTLTREFNGRELVHVALRETGLDRRVCQVGHLVLEHAAGRGLGHAVVVGEVCVTRYDHRRTRVHARGR